MRTLRSWFGLGLLAVGTAGCASPTEEPSGDAVSSATAFVGATIIDGTGGDPVTDGVLVIEDGRVVSVGSRPSVAIPPGAAQVDLAGKTIMPGIINSHGHAGEDTLRKLDVFARYGVTTVVSLGDEGPEQIAIRDAQDPSAVDVARLQVAGPVIEATTESEAVSQVEALVAMNVDWVKIRIDDENVRPAPVRQAVIDTAHANGLRVAAHIYYLEDAKDMLRRGVDMIAHSVRDQDVDAELIELMNRNDICLSPTLVREVSTFIYEETPEFFADPFFLYGADPGAIERLQDPEAQAAMARDPIGQANKVGLEVAQRNLRTLLDGGVRIAFGTDSGANEGRFPGYFEHLEMELMAEAGLTPMEIIVSATGAAAECMGLDDVGTLSVGRWADFLVLGENPLDDTRHTRTLESVWIAGNPVQR